MNYFINPNVYFFTLNAQPSRRREEKKTYEELSWKEYGLAEHDDSVICMLNGLGELILCKVVKTLIEKPMIKTNTNDYQPPIFVENKRKVLTNDYQPPAVMTVVSNRSIEYNSFFKDVSLGEICFKHNNIKQDVEKTHVENEKTSVLPEKEVNHVENELNTTVHEENNMEQQTILQTIFNWFCSLWN